MRQNQQNKNRMRGRSRKGPNPLTRTFESNGPDVKIRGTALHIAEKYTQLARDASSSGDRVMAENYLQHAEHYYRVIAVAQAALQPATGFGQNDMAEDAEDDLEPIGSDRFEPRQIDMRIPNGNGHYQGDRDQPPQQQHVRNDQDRDRETTGATSGTRATASARVASATRATVSARAASAARATASARAASAPRATASARAASAPRATASVRAASAPRDMPSVRAARERGDQRHGNQDRGEQQRHNNQERRDRNDRRPRYERGNFDRRNDRGEQRPFEPRPVAAGGPHADAARRTATGCRVSRSRSHPSGCRGTPLW